MFAYHQQMKAEETDGVTKNGFKISPGRVRIDGSVAPLIKKYYRAGDPAIPKIISRLFGYR